MGPAQPLPLRFRPILKERVWGGRKLETILGKALPGPGPYGESWDIADCGPDVSVVEGGPFDGRDLRSLVAERPEALLGRPGSGFPLLFKCLDAAAPLSVQLHPGPLDAVQPGAGSGGKSEAWVVLDAAPGAWIVHGLKAGTDREAFLDALEAGDVERAVGLLRYHPARRGDLHYLPAGTIHAMGEGILALEVQEPSDVTYRLHDWGRLGLDGRPRELHLEKARAVRARPEGTAAPPASVLGRRSGPLLRGAPFRLDLLSIDPGRVERIDTAGPEGRRFAVLCGFSGRAAVSAPDGRGERPVGPGDHLLIPAAAGGFLARAGSEPFVAVLAGE